MPAPGATWEYRLPDRDARNRVVCSLIVHVAETALMGSTVSEALPSLLPCFLARSERGGRVVLFDIHLDLEPGGAKTGRELVDAVPSWCPAA